MPPLITHEQLLRAERLLYMSHLAIGDLVYQGVWLEALKSKYPQLVIDVWFDDCRSRPHSWAAGRNATLSEWLASMGCFDRLYPIVKDRAERQAQIREAGGRGYDLIVFIGKNRSEQFARVARLISESAFVVASKSRPLGNAIAKWWHFRRLDGQFSFDEYAAGCEHVSEIYAMAFRRVFGLTSEDTGGRKLVAITIDPRFSRAAEEFVRSIGRGGEARSCVFLSHLGTAARKNYPWEQLKEVILALHERREGLVFVINSPPDRYAEIGSLIEGDERLGGLAVKPFTAADSFFELPALMSACAVVVSVDTATSHLAASLEIPQVTLMADRSTLWRPLGDGIVLEGNGRAGTIAAARVVEAADELLSRARAAD